MNLSEILAAGYDPARFAQGRIRRSGQPLTPEEMDQINAEQQAERMRDPRLATGIIGNNPQMPLPRFGASGSWEPGGGASGSWEDPRGSSSGSWDESMPQQPQQLRDLVSPQPPVQPMQPGPSSAPQQTLRDLASVRDFNPIDNPSVPVPSGTGMIRNNRTGATYALGGGDSAGNASGIPDYTRPIEIFGQGKGYAIKGEPLAALINGRRVDYGVDSAAGRAADMQKLQMATAQQKLQEGNADIRLKEAQINAMPNKQTPQQTAAYNFGLKEVAKDDAAVQQAAAVEQAAKRWQELNAKVTTGRIAGTLIPAIGNPERQELVQLQNFLTMNNFKPGQGAISNIEREFMKGSGPTLSNDKETNDNITRIMIGAAQNAKDRANFREMWLQQKGNLLGADAAWQKYLDTNPRYIPGNDGQLMENTNRVDIMSALSGTPQQPAAQAQPMPQQARPGANSQPFVVATPDGRKFSFPTQAQADGFRKAAGI